MTHRGVTASAVQTGVWEVPMVLGEALLIDGMSALLLIIFMAASREHVQSSGFAGLLLPCLFPEVTLQTQAVVSILTKDLKHLLPAYSSMSWPCGKWSSDFMKLCVCHPIPSHPIHGKGPGHVLVQGDLPALHTMPC